MNHIIRLATVSDSQAILNIYEPYVRDTAVSFETKVPSIDEFSCRIEAIGKKYPYLLYQINEEVIGYAYASSHRERAAYLYDVDVSIYVLPNYHGSGIAHQLYGCLFEVLKELGYYNVYAAYTIPNEKSMHFHKKFGFNLIGTHHKTGYKFGKWHDVTWLEKSLNEYNEKPTITKVIGDLSDEQLKGIFYSYIR